MHKTSIIKFKFTDTCKLFICYLYQLSNYLKYSNTVESIMNTRKWALCQYISRIPNNFPYRLYIYIYFFYFLFYKERIGAILKKKKKKERKGADFQFQSPDREMWGTHKLLPHAKKDSANPNHPPSHHCPTCQRACPTPHVRENTNRNSHSHVRIHALAKFAYILRSI